MNDLETTLKQHFDKLPKDVQEAILSVNYGEVLTDITKRYRLHIDQGAKLETETTLVMLGLSTPKDYSKNLIFEARIDPKIAQLIVAEVNEKIFRPIIDSLHHVLSEQFGETEEHEQLTEDRSHDLSPVELGVSTVTMPETTSNVVRQTPKTAEQERPIVMEQKLTGISGLKSSETVVTEVLIERT
jgi:hypothetical protein